MISTTIGGKIKGVDRGAKIIQLEGKGQTIQFRLASGQMAYDAKHFMKTEDGKWEVTACKRILNEEECELCNRFFEEKQIVADYVNEQKETGLAIDKIRATDEYKELDKKARKYEPKIEFYYLIINREEQMLQVLQTTIGVRLKIDEKAKQLKGLGGDIMDYDFILTRTEIPGSGYYQLDQVESKLTAELTESELASIEEAKGYDLSGMLKKKSSTKSLDEKDNTEKVGFEDAVDLMGGKNPNGKPPWEN